MIRIIMSLVSIYRMLVFSTLCVHVTLCFDDMTPDLNRERSQSYTKQLSNVAVAITDLLRFIHAREQVESDVHRPLYGHKLISDGEYSPPIISGHISTILDQNQHFETDAVEAKLNKRSLSTELSRYADRRIPERDRLITRRDVINFLLRRIYKNEVNGTKSGGDRTSEFEEIDRRRLSRTVKKLRKGLRKSDSSKRKHDARYGMPSGMMAAEIERPRSQAYRRLSKLMGKDQTETPRRIATNTDEIDTFESEAETDQFIFGGDDRRFVNRTVRRRPPYYNVARLSVGCTGMLITPSHVLTSAHCLHNGTHFTTHPDYLFIEVPHFVGNRVYRTASISVPQHWLKSDEPLKAIHDYGIVELLVQVQGRRFFPHIGLPKGASVSNMISFAGFPSDRPQMWETTCTISDDDFAMEDNLLQTRCDAAPGSSGSAVFMNVRRSDDRYERRLVGLVSHMTRTIRNGRLTPVNVITVITPAKRVVICAMADASGQYAHLCSARTTESRGRNKILSLQSTKRA